jgi:hypothetical protein
MTPAQRDRLIAAHSELRAATEAARPTSDEQAAARELIAWLTECEAAIRRQWPAVLGGDVDAAQAVLDLTKQRAEILDLRWPV